jgi:hypothetical protein
VVEAEAFLFLLEHLDRKKRELGSSYDSLESFQTLMTVLMNWSVRLQADSATTCDGEPSDNCWYQFSETSEVRTGNRIPVHISDMRHAWGEISELSEQESMGKGCGAVAAASCDRSDQVFDTISYDMAKTWLRLVAAGDETWYVFTDGSDAGAYERGGECAPVRPAKVLSKDAGADERGGECAPVRPAKDLSEVAGAYVFTDGSDGDGDTDNSREGMPKVEAKRRTSREEMAQVLSRLGVSDGATFVISMMAHGTKPPRFESCSLRR